MYLKDIDNKIRWTLFGGGGAERTYSMNMHIRSSGSYTSKMAAVFGGYTTMQLAVT